MIKYSFIIPHYNIPDLLMRCIKSIPIRDDIQIIVVDDCSPEANLYLKKYPLLSNPIVEFYSTEKNGSAGRARNVGLKHTCGEWVVFLDADDYLNHNAEDLLDHYYNYNEDVLYFRTQYVLSNDTTKKVNRFPELDDYISDYLKYGKEEGLRYHHASQWSMMIKRNIIQENHISFDETRWSNDVMFSFLVGYYAKNIKAIDDTFFICTQRDGSLASSQFNKKRNSYSELLCRFDVSRRVYKFAIDHNLPGMTYNNLTRPYAKLIKKPIWYLKLLKYLLKVDRKAAKHLMINTLKLPIHMLSMK